MNNQAFRAPAKVRYHREGLPAGAASFPTSRQKQARYGAPGFVAGLAVEDKSKGTLPLIVAVGDGFPPNEQPSFSCLRGSALSPGRLGRESSFISHISPKAGEIPGFPLRGTKQSPRVRLSLRKAARGSSTPTRFTGKPGYRAPGVVARLAVEDDRGLYCRVPMRPERMS
jgi:hypothetical protein